MRRPRFLKNPAEIRTRVKELQSSSKLDLAVAFIGADWWELLADHRGKLRVICWLSSTNTNPYAVEELMNRPNTEVRQRDWMHCKVYLSPAVGAVVGSANLSKAALSEDEVAGQDEAAVLLTAPSTVHEIEKWFGDLWKDSHTRRIQESDLASAKDSWKNAQQSRQKTRLKSKHHRGAPVRIPVVPFTFDPIILFYAKKVRSIDLESDIGEPCAFVQSIEPGKLNKHDHNQLVDQIVSWTGHRSSYDNFLAQPIAAVRKGLQSLFDDALDLQTRLENIQQDGDLDGLRMPSLGLLLYWRNPERFVPYNFRTVKFLRDFRLENQGMSGSSPRCYVTWLGWATRLAQRLKLPTLGHVDRMVEHYYEDEYADT